MHFISVFSEKDRIRKVKEPKWRGYREGSEVWISTYKVLEGEKQTTGVRSFSPYEL